MNNWGDDDLGGESIWSVGALVDFVAAIRRFYHRYKEPIKWIVCMALIVWCFWLAYK